MLSHSTETRIRIGDSVRRACASPEHREVMSAALRDGWAHSAGLARRGRAAPHLDALTAEEKVEYRRLQKLGRTRDDILHRLAMRRAAAAGQPLSDL